VTGSRSRSAHLQKVDHARALAADVLGHERPPPSNPLPEAEPLKLAEKIVYRYIAHRRRLPDRQRQVVTLRDIEGLTSEEVCGVLEISEGNQRVLLHRGRSRLRQAVEAGFGRPS